LRIALKGLGLAPMTNPEWMAKAAQAAERCGFSSIFVGEHFAFFDSYEAPYPYLPGGQLPIETRAEIFEPYTTLTWLAAHTKTIRLGICVSIVPFHNPLHAAKQIATVDQLSGGRLVFGAGVGWSQEEYRAVGVPWERRWFRMDDYVNAMRCLWAEEPRSTYQGEFVKFEDAYSYPKPKAGKDLPVWYGGNGDMMLRRVARNGHGWMGMNLQPEEVAQKIQYIREQAEAAGRHPDSIEMTAQTWDWPKFTVDDYRRYRDAGLKEFFVFGLPGPHVDENNAVAWVEEVARQTVDVAARM
jgi:probable F420-dependent oxidoreductase